MGKLHLEGKVIGNYRFLHLIGEGAYAEVYLAEHILLNRQVAIKVSRVPLTGYETEDFLKEARIIANLEHDNIVHVDECFLDENLPFLVMKYAPNGSFRNAYPVGTKIPLLQVASYVKQIASALQYAHNTGLIHRDVKPDNMLLGANNKVLLSDFGIATIIQSTITLSSERYQREWAGTLNYIAPEQLKGKPCPASDQYALGIVVYEWISGSSPFRGTEVEMIGQQLFNLPPPLSQKVSGLPEAIDQVVMKALAKEPGERYTSVSEFAEALERAILTYENESQRLLEVSDSDTLVPAEPDDTLLPFVCSNEQDILTADPPVAKYTDPLLPKYTDPPFVAPKPNLPISGPSFGIPAPSKAQHERKLSRRSMIGGLIVLAVGTIATAIVVSHENQINSNAGAPTPTRTAKPTATNPPRSTATSTQQPTTSTTPQPGATATAPPSLPPATTVIPKLNGKILAEDTFHRSNQSHWGMASDGLNWQGDANSVSNFSIAGDKGQVTGDGIGYNASIGRGVLNSEVVLTCCASAFAPLGSSQIYQIGPVLRSQHLQDGEYFYKAFITGTEFFVSSKVQNNTGFLLPMKFVALPNTWYTIRFRAIGMPQTTLMAKVWRTADPEPSNWMLTKQDNEVSLQQAGQAGFRPQIPGGVTAQISYFGLTTG